MEVLEAAVDRLGRAVRSAGPVEAGEPLVVTLVPGAGDASGTMVAAGTPEHVADKGVGASARYLAAALEEATGVTPS